MFLCLKSKCVFPDHPSHIVSPYYLYFYWFIFLSNSVTLFLLYFFHYHLSLLCPLPPPPTSTSHNCYTFVHDSFPFFIFLLNPFIPLNCLPPESCQPALHLGVCLCFACQLSLFIRFHIWVKSYVFLSNWLV